MSWNDHSVQFSIVYAANDNCIRGQYQTTWSDLCGLLMDPPQLIADKKDNWMLIPSSFKEQDYEPAIDHDENIKYQEDGIPFIRRSTPNLLHTYMLPLDIDGEMPLIDARQKFKNFEYVGYTSHSHRSERKNGKDCYRLFLLLKTPIDPVNLLKRRPVMWRWLGKGCADDSSLSLTRGFYLPAQRTEDAPFESWHNHGTPIDWTRCPEEKKPVFKPRPKEDIPIDKQKIIDDLSSHYIGHEPRWYAVAIAMVEAGFDENDFISATIGGMMNSKSNTDCTKKWAKAENDVRNGATRGGIGYLINEIKGKH